jgi:hypothetical protein
MSSLSIDDIKRRTSEMTLGPADEFAGFFAYDILVESQQGTARGLMGLTVAVIESMLRDLLISDPLPPLPEVSALISPGGALDGRQALLNHLSENVIDSQTRDAIQALFSCDRERFGYGSLPAFNSETINILTPFLTYSTPDDIDTSPRGLTPDSARDDFFRAFNSLTLKLLTHIGNRQRGLE